jgi:hypothetical protein
MRVLTINELMRLTRTELCGLAVRITAELPTYRKRLATAYRRVHHPSGTSAGSWRSATCRPSRCRCKPAGI